ncbi:AsmA-like C-terminal domain-containing protein [Salinarimonas sp.]|uniref:AsmA-like C-terminal domain-containing protein n=1 Tax=Salinarimonas sp. TaxID=2766526 RepID=UPI0032D8F3B6
MARRVLVAKAWIAAALLVAASLLYIRLDHAPIAVAGLSEEVVTALESRLGPGWRVRLAESELTLHEGAIALAVDGFDLSDASGARVAHAPRAVVAVGALSLARGAPSPKSIALQGVELRARIAEDGTLSLLPAQPADAAPGASAMVEPGPPIDLADPVGLAAGLLAAALDGSTPLGALAQARLEDARLTLVDARGRERVAFSDVDARIWRDGRARRFTAQVRGPGGVWSMAGAVSRDRQGGQTAEVMVDRLPVHDVALLSGLSGAFGSDDLALTGTAEIAIGADGALRAFSAGLASNAGWLLTRDPYMPLVPVERLAVETSWDAEQRLLAVHRLELAGGRTRVALAGALRPEGEGGRWRLALDGRDAVVRGPTAEEPVVPLSRVSVRARGGPQGVIVEEVALDGPGVDLAMMLSFGGVEDRGGLRVALDAADMPVRTALALWPDFVAPVPRLFLRDAVGRGVVRELEVAVVLTGEDIAGLFRKEDLPEEAIAVGFAIDEARLALGDALPPLRDVSVSGFVSGRDARVDASRAHLLLPDGRRLDAAGGRFRLEEFWDRDAQAEIAFSASSGLDDLAAFLSLPALAGAADIVLDPDDVSGEVALDVSFAFPVSRPVEIAALPIAAEGVLEEVSAPVFEGAERLEQGSLALAFAADGTLTLEGEGLLAGEPVEVALTQPRGGPTRARLSGTLEASRLAARGLVPEGRLAGPLGLTVDATLGPDEAVEAAIEADLGQARVSGLLPGWSKEPGAPGRFAVRVETGNDGLVFDGLALESGSVAIAGAGRLSAEGALQEIALSRLRLSPGDDASARAVRQADGALAVAIEGNVLDLRPVLSALRERGAGDGAADDVDLEARVDILGGFGGEVLTGVTARASLRGGAVRSARLEGRFPNAPVIVTVAPGGAGPRLTAESADAGATLRFLDVYDKMVRGRLYLDVGLSEARGPGTLIVWEFLIRDEPALRRLVNRENPAGGAPAARFGLSGPDNVNEALFTKAQVDFIRDGSVVTLADARIWGPQVGFTADGWIDLERRTLDVAGAFVPAYGLNNAFAQVPVVGMILGGNQYEGLFAVNFRLEGEMASPALSVNPLSAIAPGVLRRLFGAGAPTRRPADLGEAPVAPPLDIGPPQR